MPDAAAVTVVIPTRDRAGFVVEAVSSALAQRGVTVEVVVVEDGSRDGTREAVLALGDERVTVVRNDPGRGVAHARNRGITCSAYPWTAFLDDDDRWSPDKLRVQLDLLSAQRADFAYTAGVAVDRGGRVLYASPAFTPAELRLGIRSRNLIFAGSSNVVARTDLLRGLGGFDETLHHIADWDLWIRLTEAGRPAASPQLLVAYVVHEANMHRTAIDSARREGRRLRDKHAQSTLPGRFDDVVFRDWIAEGQADSGRRPRAALTYAVTALRHRRLAEARRAVSSALHAARLGTQRDRPPFDGPVPDWLAPGP
jgi:glycosyltransferase involved in cell wall biosynthesis